MRAMQMWLTAGLLGAGAGCASERPQLVGSEPNGFTEVQSAAEEPEVEALSAKSDSDEARKKLIEEYKALALKNDCSRGKRDMSGVWRFAGESKTPEYTAEMTIEGTRFVEKLGGRPDGKRVDATIEGEVRCLFKNRVLFQLDKVAPEGAYGNKSGDLYPCDILSDMDPTVDRMLMSCYFEWDMRPSAAFDFEFERVK